MSRLIFNLFLLLFVNPIGSYIAISFPILFLDTSFFFLERFQISCDGPRYVRIVTRLLTINILCVQLLHCHSLVSLSSLYDLHLPRLSLSLPALSFLSLSAERVYNSYEIGIYISPIIIIFFVFGLYCGICNRSSAIMKTIYDLVVLSYSLTLSS